MQFTIPLHRQVKPAISFSIPIITTSAFRLGNYRHLVNQLLSSPSAEVIGKYPKASPSEQRKEMHSLTSFGFPTQRRRHQWVYRFEDSIRDE
ncbi:hypothetical protein FOWG_07698 [Fusarium oxysporum f. sp. lycopersici MN25]|uniref:Uncharacterized protein n=1 Tax=Fusarium oxysporum f. sp. cepae TaxID=396571 RepID=A0A3L6NQ53_FUSOX|nr:hypothetical protein FOWG_07698 [Fusarium oxysporum f. sp. lycopersici MN25]RKK20209.1 hypothetical protein BFJ65_g6908 [Fusarium oxysporum f. sp. cepae]RKK40771.1 hypothetical protein BFJ67_g10806 [Fusarium oxysporum f. sp. cepae]